MQDKLALDPFCYFSKGIVILRSDQRLRHISSNDPFNFEVRDNDEDYNQKHYEAFGEVRHINLCCGLTSNQCYALLNLYCKIYLSLI